jgi:hypothetical protein
VRRRCTLAAALVAAAACGGASQASAAPPRQLGSFTYTSTAPGTPTGTVADFEFQNPENPSEKPHAVASMAIRTPDGGVVDTTALPQCHASDAQLYVEGPAGCPSDSKVGSGTAVTDSGPSGPFPRYSTATISDFNGSGEVIGVGVDDSVPLIRSVDHTKLAGSTSSTMFPVFPGAPPPDPYMPIKSLRIQFPPYVRDGRAYNRTPPTCPQSGYWTITATFTYHDGVTQSIGSHSPCQRPATAAVRANRRAARKHRRRRHRRAARRADG